MELNQIYMTGIPLSPGTFGQDDKQQLIWGYPGVLWNEAAQTHGGYQGNWISIRIGL